MAAVVMDHSRCGKCHRALTNEESRRRGFGPVCWKKVGGKEDSARDLMESMPRTIVDAPIALNAFSVLRRRIFDAVAGQTCDCGEHLDDGEVGSYDHAGGIKLAGFGERQWAYLKCKCGHCMAYHHITGLKHDDPESPNSSFKAPTIAEV